MSNKLYSWAVDLFPFCRSLSGPGVRETLRYIKSIIKNLSIKNIRTGTRAYDWKVPEEWIVKDAYIKNMLGKKIVNFKKNNLHLVGYSHPINKIISLSELQNHLHSIKNNPTAIPYITSYYKKNWGFCLTHNQRKKLKNKKYKVFINSKLKKGNLNYGELIIPGKSKKEILLSTNICHPSMGNNEVSGIVVTTALAKWILEKKDRKFTYRILFLPETIGAIYYISKYKKYLKKNIIAGFNVVCVGDNKKFSILKSRANNSLSDRAALLYFKNKKIKPKIYDFIFDRGSDERQYCWPGIDLPICSVMRSKYNTYKEYHTSKDDLKFISQKGLNGSFNSLKEIIKIIEINKKLSSKSRGRCEPFMTKYKLYPTLSDKNSFKVATMMNVILLASEGKDLIDISSILNKNPLDIKNIVERLIKLKLINEKKY